jgi:histidinol-phosphate aminotransferase
MKITDLILPHIQSLQPYSSARNEYQGEATIFLDANENPFGTLNRYPDPNQKKLKALVAKQKGIAAEQLFIGNGSDEVIDLIFRVFTQPQKDKVLIFTPTYGMYQVTADIHNVEVVQLPLKEQFQPDVNDFIQVIQDSDIKVVFICSPNNPTGNCIDIGSIEFILQQFKGVVVVDEAYIDFVAHKSTVSLLHKYPNLIISQTLSKAWGLAGARVGMAYAHPEVISTLNKVKAPYNISRLNQLAAIEAIENAPQMAQNMKRVLQERERLAKRLDELPMVKMVYPSDANFLLVQFDDADYVYEALRKQGIIVRNRSNQVAQTLRISIGTPEENNLLFNTLKSIK